MRKDNRRHILIRNLGNLILHLTTKQTIGQTPPGGNRHGCQFHLPAYVSERIYIGHVRILIFVDDDVLFGRDLDTGRFEVEGFGVGYPFCGVGFSSCCHEYDVGSINDISAVQRHILLLTVIQSNLGNTIRMPMNNHTRLNHLVIQPIANQRIKLSQRLTLPHHQMNFRTQTIQHACQLHGNISRTHHNRHLGKVFHRKETIGRYAMFFDSFSRREDRFASRGNENLFRSVLHLLPILIRHLHSMIVHETALSKNTSNTRSHKPIGINSIQPLDIIIPRFLQLAKIQLGFNATIVESVMCHVVFQRVGNVGGAPHDFFGNASDVDAGAAETIAFDAEDFFAVGG
mmetsp:Transcript_30557/g.56052  ORF Transcript_30557/g.56052 Transcript_30557/m.56052 type:complete len:344 (+) Transcript_30557:503-1534(+)